MRDYMIKFPTSINTTCTDVRAFGLTKTHKESLKQHGRMCLIMVI